MNNKNIFGRFYPNNISYLGKSLSKQGTIVFFRTKLYPKDNLNCDKNNKIQLLHIVLWSRIIIAHHLALPLTCVLIVYPREKFIIRLPSNISPPPTLSPSVGEPQFIFIRIEIFWFISHGASGETLSETNTELLQLSSSCVDTRVIPLSNYYCRPWLCWPETWGGRNE